MDLYIKDVTNFQRFCINIVKCGSRPNHIAFIVDGNRRYSKKANISLKESYHLGFNKLYETLIWCDYLGVKEVSYYLLSIHNIERSDREVETLLKMLQLVSISVNKELEKLLEREICVKMKGDTSLIPNDIKKLLMEAEMKTMDCTGIVLNIAIFYTSHSEITNAVAKIVKSKGIRSENINKELITKNLYIERNVDLLIRTSGETRLSNFLLWQVSQALIVFEENNWPEFSFWNFCKILLRYQHFWNSKSK